MASLEEIRETRLEKINKLKAFGMNPYPAHVKRDYSLKDLKEKFDTVGGPVSVSGRVMALRGQGAILFVVLFDGTEKFQTVFKKDEIDEKLFALFSDTVDVGDFIQVTGTLFVTERGEKSLLVSSWMMVSKSLAPLPEKWHGITDPDERYRKRYLDILMDEELRGLLEKRSVFWKASRDFMLGEGFLEIETPTIETTTGGAEARPFKTFHNDFGLDVYMRISVGELWQKRALAAGFPKVFEIGRVYRNEGSSPEHLQEFTNMECYAAYMDYKDGMQFVERMVKEVVQKTFNTLQFSIKGHDVDLAGSWDVIEYVPYVLENTGVNVLTDSDDVLRNKLTELGVVYDGATRERMIDSLWKYCRKGIGGPVWLINHPKIVSPLAKARPENPETVERCQLIMAGSEFSNSFSELNDPIDQRARFEEQQKLIERGDDEAMMPDFEFVEMLEHGMPPAFGSAPVGDRMFAVLAGQPIRETVMFPLMRPKSEGTGSKKKETMLAVAVINGGAGLANWQELNTVAHLNAAFGARVGKGLFTQDIIRSKDNVAIKLNTKQAIMIKVAPSGAALQALAQTAKEQKLEVDEFTREMIETTNDKKVIEITASKNYDEVEYLGVLVYGPKSLVEEATAEFKLHS